MNYTPGMRIPVVTRDFPARLLGDFRSTIARVPKLKYGIVYHVRVLFVSN